MSSHATGSDEILVNTHKSGNQYNSSVTTLADGGWVSTWQSDGQDGDGYGIYQQRYDADGHKVGHETLVNSFTTGDQDASPASGLLDGGWVVTWVSHGQDGDSGGIYQQRYGANGSTVGDETLVNTSTSGDQTNTSVVGLKDGGWVVTWESLSDFGIHMQRYNVDGTTNGEETQVDPGSFDFKTQADVSALKDGGWIVTWQSKDSTGGSGSGDIYQQRYDSRGGTVGGETLVNAFTTGDQTGSSVTGLVNGGWVVTWQSADQDGDGLGIYQQHYDASGIAQGETPVNTHTAGDQTYSQTTALADGGWLVTWVSNGQDGDDEGIYQQRYAATGGKVGGETRVNITTTGTQFIPAVTGLVDGGWIVTWSSTDQQGSGVYQRHFATDIVGNGSGNKLTGTNWDEYLIGNGGDDTLDGRGGDDVMVGGTGDDTYIVNSRGDTVDETGGGGTDLVKSSISWTLGKGQDNLTLTGSSKINATGNGGDNTLKGNSAANILDGKTGDDVMMGGAGNDTYIVDSHGDKIDETGGGGTDLVKSSVSWTLGKGQDNLTLTGSSKINATGNGGDNILKGNSAANILDGKAGDDVMMGGAGNDTYVVDSKGDKLDETGGSGTDLVKSSISWTLGKGLDNLTLMGSSKINATGNGGDNVLKGNSANNILDGKTGDDVMMGGAGSDTYIVDSRGDKVDETGGSGTDLVKSSVSWTLSSGVEKLTLTGSSKINGNGNGGNNVLTGNAASNILDGKGGNDTLIGGAGSDTLIGGTGNDSYYVSSASDKISESGGSGTDKVYSSFSITLQKDENLPASIKLLHYTGSLEQLQLTGSSDLAAYGNTLNNVITGNSGDNALRGFAGNDTLVGGSGSDILRGGSGADKLIGGTGTDMADYLDSKTDVVVNLASPSHNTGYAKGDTFSSIENLRGSAHNDTLTGTSGANTIYGGEGRDTIEGGGGADKLYGGADADKFVFRSVSASTKSNMDTIYDFTSADKIDLHLIDANTHASGNQNFTFIGTSAFDGKSGELRYEKHASDTYIYADVNGDKKVDFAIHLDDAVTLQKDDFSL